MEDPSLKEAAGAIAKIVLYICLAVISCFWLHSCELKEETIESCRTSCSKGLGNTMESVTARKCICTSVQEQTPWVLPKK